ncbi:MAG: exosortase A [Rubrivivax sp.]|nr:exosortase A [Rubrivivax sp.]
MPWLVAALVGVLLLYRETATLMVGVWRNSETYAHAFLVPPISAWLVWRQRHALALTVPQPSWWVLLPMAGALLAWLAGDLVSVNSVTQFALVAMLVLTVPLVIGWASARTILFPLGFLFFMVPVGEFLLPLLMEWTADFTVGALMLTGIPVYREGQQFVIPSGNWSVVEACSGVRYLIASLMVGTLFAYLNYRAMWRRWVFVGVSIIVPIVANWLRAYMIVMLGHLSNNRIAVGVDHLVYGWVFFGIVIMLMFWIGARWAEPDAPLPVAGPADGAGIAGVAAGWRHAPQAAALVGVLLLSAAPGAVAWLERDARASSLPQLALPGAIGTWQAQEPAKAPQDWAPTFHNPRALAVRGYRDAYGDVVLHVAYFRAQDYGSKLVSSMHQITTADDATWNRSNPPPLQVAGGTWRIALLQGSPTLSSISRTKKILVARAYWVDGRFTTSDIDAKRLNAVSRLRGHGDDGAIVMVHAVADDEAEAQQRLIAYLQQAQPAIDAMLRGVSGRH